MSAALIIAILQAAAPLIEALIAEARAAGSDLTPLLMAQDHIGESVAHLQVAATATPAKQ